MNAKIYVEGGGDSKELQTRRREGFRKLLSKCGFTGRMPRLVACGGRNAAFDGFRTAHAYSKDGNFVALLVDSEDPVAEIEQTWTHLQKRDGWERPAGSHYEQVLLMTTCMETWIVCDRQTLQDHFGNCLQENALPSPENLEKRERGAVQNALLRATRSCRNSYAKGKQSFEILGKLNPSVLSKRLPSFARCQRVFEKKL